MPTRGCGSRPRRFAATPPSRSDAPPTPGVPSNVGPSTCSSCDASGSWSRSRPHLCRQRAGRHAVSLSLDPDAEHRILVAVSAVGRPARTWPGVRLDGVSRPGAERTNGVGRMAAPRSAGLRCAAVFGAAFTRPATVPIPGEWKDICRRRRHGDTGGARIRGGPAPPTGGRTDGHGARGGEASSGRRPLDDRQRCRRLHRSRGVHGSRSARARLS